MKNATVYHQIKEGKPSEDKSHEKRQKKNSGRNAKIKFNDGAHAKPKAVIDVRTVRFYRPYLATAAVKIKRLLSKGKRKEAKQIVEQQKDGKKNEQNIVCIWNGKTVEHENAKPE